MVVSELDPNTSAWLFKQVLVLGYLAARVFEQVRTGIESLPKGKPMLPMRSGSLLAPDVSPYRLATGISGDFTTDEPELTNCFKNASVLHWSGY